MSAKDRWMPLDVGDYLADTGHLTTLQHGAYCLMLMHYWKSGPLPDNDVQLAAIARVDSKTWRSMRDVIRRFFDPRDGCLHQKRADIERAKTAKLSGVRSGAGKAGAEARWKQDDGKPPDKPDGKPIANATDLPSEKWQKPDVCHDFANAPVPSQKNLSSSLTRNSRAQGDENPPETRGVGQQATGNVVAMVQKAMRTTAYPPGRKPLRAPDEQAAAVRKPAIKAAPLNAEQLAAARRLVMKTG